MLSSKKVALLILSVMSFIFAWGEDLMSNAEINKVILERIRYYQSLKVDNAEYDAQIDIKNNTIKLFFLVGETLELIDVANCPFEYDVDFNFKEIPNYSKKYIGEGDVIVDDIQLTDTYMNACTNAVAYGEIYNNIIFNYFNNNPK
jgi:hypothetical protein